MAKKAQETVQDDNGASEVTAETAPVKTPRPATVVEEIQMLDGRTVGFAGKIQMSSEVIFDENGLPGVRFDFRNGQTLTEWVPEQHRSYAAGHGWKQRLGDEIAGAKDDNGQPISNEDRYLAIEAFAQRLKESETWLLGRSSTGGSDSVSGANLVIQALVEATGKSVEEVKALLNKQVKSREERWEAGGSKGAKPTRRSLYATYRQPDSKTGIIIARLQTEALAKNASAESADDVLAELEVA